jgi:hypothetical protein
MGSMGWVELLYQRSPQHGSSQGQKSLSCKAALGNERGMTVHLV